MECGREIYANDRIPPVVRKFLDGRNMLNTGVVNDNVEGAELMLGRVDQTGDFIWLGHIRAGIRDLDSVQIRVEDLALRRPTLDDVYLALTGRAAEETDEPTEIPAARPMERIAR